MQVLRNTAFIYFCLKYTLAGHVSTCPGSGMSSERYPECTRVVARSQGRQKNCLIRFSWLPAPHSIPFHSPGQSRQPPSSSRSCATAKSRIPDNYADSYLLRPQGCRKVVVTAQSHRENDLHWFSRLLTPLRHPALLRDALQTTCGRTPWFENSLL